MSLLSKIAGGIAKVLPIAAAIAPSSSRVAQAVGTLQKVGNALTDPFSFALSAATRGVGAVGAAPMSVAAAGLPALPRAVATGSALAVAGGRALVQAGRGLTRRYGKKAMAALNLFAVGSIVYDAATGQAVGTRYTRKINPLNHKELRFAIRRVKAAARVGRDIEKVLGKGALSRLSRC